MLIFERMRTLFILFSFSILSSFSNAHNYYFGFAEMQYNALNKTLETTIVLSAHDLDEILMKENKISKHLEHLSQDSSGISIVGNEIQREFSIKADQKTIRFQCIGFEVLKNGLINIYLLAENVAPPKSLEINFSCLMKHFPEQQNKLTFIDGNKKLTEVFLPNKPTSTILLN